MHILLITKQVSVKIIHTELLFWKYNWFCPHRELVSLQIWNFARLLPRKIGRLGDCEFKSATQVGG